MATTTETTTLTSALTGTDCKVLIAMMMLQRSLSTSGLGKIIGMSRQSTATALDHLANLGLVQNHGAGNGGKWRLTTQARQFIMGEMQPTLTTHSQGILSVKNFNTGTCGGGGGTYIHDDHETLVVATATSSTVKKVNTQTGQAALDFLSNHNYDPQRATETTQQALAAGWTDTECLDCVREWYNYAHSPAGHWITSPVGYAAYALKTRRKPPQKPEPAEIEDNPYIPGEYGDVIHY